MMFTQNDVAIAMQKMDLPEQVATMEKWLADLGMEAVADQLTIFLMTTMLDLDGGEYSPELVARVDRMLEQVKTFNEIRFAQPNS